MDKLLPFLEVSGPDGQQFHVELANDRVTIGRFEQFNDVALEPDCVAYSTSIMAMPAMQEWIAAAKAEPDELEELDVEF